MGPSSTAMLAEEIVPALRTLRKSTADIPNKIKVASDGSAVVPFEAYDGKQYEVTVTEVD